MTEIKVVQDRNEVIQSLSRDRPIQVYGLADLELPVWIASTWWRRGAAFVAATWARRHRRNLRHLAP
jgi:hypothetical protein